MAHPRVSVVAAVVEQQQGTGPPQGFDQLCEDGLALRIDPVQVVNQQYDRFGRALRLHQTANESAELLALCFRFQRRRRVFWIRQPENIQDQPQLLLDGTTQTPETRLDSSPARRRAFVRRNFEE